MSLFFFVEYEERDYSEPIKGHFSADSAKLFMVRCFALSSAYLYSRVNTCIINIFNEYSFSFYIKIVKNMRKITFRLEQLMVLLLFRLFSYHFKKAIG